MVVEDLSLELLLQQQQAQDRLQLQLPQQHLYHQQLSALLDHQQVDLDQAAEAVTNQIR